ncbi:MAG: peptide ABC transporter substrate-binding protein [Puniceicoccales bacterium]|jgi:oligopeptide transport system substrate-binding protein|nr:peptide ABC transporter substrate-binding protein [Puniceicoccales bacterium]
MKCLEKIFLVFIVFLAGCFEKERNTLHIGSSAGISTFDPHLATTLPEGMITSSIFEGLLVPHPETLEPIPGVAESYVISNDKMEYTFFLRSDAKWSNGDPVSAEDFVCAIRRGLSPILGSPWAELFFVLKNAKRYYKNEIVNFSEVGIKALDAQTLHCTLAAPIDYFLSLVTHWAWSPVNIRAIERFGNPCERNNLWLKSENIVGNGAYILKSFNIGDKIVLQKNPKYWAKENVAIKNVHIIPGINPDTEENMFITGQLDITDNVPVDKIDFYRKKGHLKSSTSLGSSFYWFNCKRQPFDDVRVRKAFNLAIDREAIGKLRNRGTGFEAYALVPPGTMNYDSSNFFEHDIKQAQKLLAEAGYPNGEGFPEITILYNINDNWKMISEAVQEMLRVNLHIHVKLQSTEWGVFLNERRRHCFDICRGGWIGDYNDATTFLNLCLSDDNNNHSQWANDAYDTTILSAGKAKDFSERKEILNKAEALMINEVPIIPLYFDSIYHLVSNRVKGWYPNILDWHLLKFIHFAAASKLN